MENVARSLTFLPKLLVGFYDKLKKLHEYFFETPFLRMVIPHKVSFRDINITLPARMLSQTGGGTRQSHDL